MVNSNLCEHGKQFCETCTRRKVKAVQNMVTPKASAAEPTTITNTGMTVQPDEVLKLRFNHTANTWQVWNYLGRYSARVWRWFSITPEQARLYSAARVPVIVEDTVGANES